MYGWRMFRPGNSIWAIVCSVGGMALSGLLHHVLLRLNVDHDTARYCAIGVLAASAVLAIVLQLHYKYHNPDL